MGRRTPSFYGAVRGLARAARQAEAANRKSQREMERQAIRAHREQVREYISLLKEEKKEEKQAYLESRRHEVDDLNEDLAERLDALQELLQHTLGIDDTISFCSLRPKQKPVLEIPNVLSTPSHEPKFEDFMIKVQKPSWFQKLIPGWENRYNRLLNYAQVEYEKAISAHTENEQKRLTEIEELKRKYDVTLKSYEQKVLEVKEFEEAYNSGDVSAIESYNAMVLERSEYPDGFPQTFQLVYVLESKELVVDYEFPTITVVPSISEYRYVKTKDEIQSKPRKVKEMQGTYEDLLLGITLRTIHEVFEADQGFHLDTVTFSGYIHSIDAATGKDIKPYLISVRATKDKFVDIDLSRIGKKACLRNLGAQVSTNPADIVPVKPVVQFNMYDKRFIEHDDFLSGLDGRPNLYELNPFEFEKVICNLFEKMGFESKLTRSAKDGGVDVIAFDSRPILGGKVVIQAKRYKNTVGVSDVRDLWGTMDHERAHKGILITTSGFGPDAYKFAENKPLELIDGGGLLYLLGEANIEARIEFPSDNVLVNA